MLKALKVEKEIDALISEFQNAYLQNYLVPNKIISKSECPKWRFHVKRYYKTLYAIPANSSEGKIATKLLWKLYDMLCYGCNTQDTFNSASFR